MFVGKFQQQWREKGRHDNQYQNEGHNRRVYESAVNALLRADEHDFRSCHHTDAHAQTVHKRVSANERAESATDNFAQKSCGDKCKAEADDCGRNRAEIRIYAYACKENGCENHIVADLDFSVDVARFGEGGKHNACNVRARDVRNAEPFFRGVRKEEAHRKAYNRDTSMVFGVAFEVVFEKQVRNDTNADCGGEEAYHFSDCDSDSVESVALVEGYEKGKKNDAYNIVEDCGGDDRSADFGVEFAEFFECGDGYADAGCRQNRAVKEVGYDLVLSHILESAVKRSRNQKPESEREQNAQNRNQNGRKAAGFELFEVGFESCRKHNEDNADFCEEGQTFEGVIGEYGLVWDVLDKAEKYACNQHAHHLRKPYFLAQKREKFGAKKYERKRKQNFKICYCG